MLPVALAFCYTNALLDGSVYAFGCGFGNIAENGFNHRFHLKWCTVLCKWVIGKPRNTLPKTKFSRCYAALYMVQFGHYSIWTFAVSVDTDLILKKENKCGHNLEFLNLYLLGR